MKCYPPSPTRAVIGICSLLAIGLGASLLWGAGGCLLTVGLVLFIDASSDEAVERFTGTKRDYPAND